MNRVKPTQSMLFAELVETALATPRGVRAASAEYVLPTPLVGGKSHHNGQTRATPFKRAKGHSDDVVWLSAALSADAVTMLDRLAGAFATTTFVRAENPPVEPLKNWPGRAGAGRDGLAHAVANEKSGGKHARNQAGFDDAIAC